MDFHQSKLDHAFYMFRILDLTAKENAIDDCLVALKKIYEKDMISLSDFLKVLLFYRLI